MWLTVVPMNGKASRDAVAEVNYAAEFFRWYAEGSVRALGGVCAAPNGANHIGVQLQPIGVSLLVTPRQFFAAMATRKIGQTLTAGCTLGGQRFGCRRRRRPARECRHA
jgi:succinate-semialdehyde dehydrogenase/glutarate-semialdehyde dehydrogenase